ncbi:recombinase family protein [Cerasicoccus frondis]|uniref:recombinase family protein n=1 Tax=Cerasicoccus frondis TaxID=490090 RepID=UPI0028527693|nr:recombinase family protein [Cerasicoccus frondis]
MAVIYARVSSKAQLKRGDGLNSQETRCREFARIKNYQVSKVFTDDVTGGVIQRPGMQAMLEYLQDNRNIEPVVIIDDINRLARDVRAHWDLRDTIQFAGGRLESPSIEFGEDSDSVFRETILAASAQHQRQKNAEQTKNRMRARIMNGYWCFQAPIGYRYERKSHHGKILVRDEPIASILQEALEGFAVGRFQTQVEVKRFLESRPEYPKDKSNGTIHPQRIPELLTRKLYAGMVEAPIWNITIRKGQHEGLISLETFNRIQSRLHSTPKTPARKDVSADFPLRGAVCCGDCGKPLTSCWSSGKKRKYPYYSCFNKECVSNRKSIPRREIEEDFVKLLTNMVPTRTLFACVRDMFVNVWNQRNTQADSIRTSVKRQISDINTQINGYLDRIVETSSTSVIAAYEQRITTLEVEKFVLEEKLNTSAPTRKDFEVKFEHAMRYLSNPLKLWHSENLNDKRTVLKLTFSDHLIYSRGEGFRTPEYSMPFKLLAGISEGKTSMARIDGNSSSELFNALADWEIQLKHLEEDI